MGRSIFECSQKINSLLLGWFVASIVVILLRYIYSVGSCPYIWHGGSPLDTFGGSCYCGKDMYCMCTPSLAIDAIIEVRSEISPSIVLVRRRDNPKDVYAIPGGYVDIGETVEHAAIREVKEETNLDLANVVQFRVYSDPGRDLRRHTVSSVMKCEVPDATGLHVGDDAKAVEIVSLARVLSLELAFDHRKVLADYITLFHPSILSRR